MNEQISDAEIKKYLETQEKLNRAISEDRLLGRRLSTYAQDYLITNTIRERNGLYQTISRLLTTAKASPGEEIQNQGGYLTFEFTNADGSLNLTASASIRFNSAQNDVLTVRHGDQVTHPFHSFFIYWDAQTGVTLKIIHAYESGNIFKFERNPYGNIGTVSQVTQIPGLNILPSGAARVSARSVSVSGGAALATLYTVTAGKTLYIQNSDLCIMCQSTYANAKLIITDGSDNELFTINLTGMGATTDNMVTESHQAHMPPIAVLAGYKVKMVKQDDAFNNVTTFSALGGFIGWEI